MQHTDVSPELITIAIAACPPLQRIYARGGGSVHELRTHMSHVLAAALSVPTQEPRVPVVDLVGRRRRHGAYAGPDRRKAHTAPDVPPGHRAA